MEYQDKVLKCAECGTEFVFTAGEQAFFADKGFRHEPKRCKNCKSTRSSGSPSGNAGRAETRAVCSQCGKETTVPFKPTQGRPVYCRECFQSRRAMGSSA
jgi:CxxC-x17-CxxC domain-containing protein